VTPAGRRSVRKPIIYPNLISASLRLQTISRKPRTSINRFTDRRPLHESLKTSIGELRNPRLQYESLKSYRDWFATVSYITKAENLNQSVCDCRLLCDSLKSYRDRFTDCRLLYRQIRICKTTIRQSEICNSILYILVPTTIYFLLYIYSFNFICSTSILQYKFREAFQETTCWNPLVQELEGVVQTNSLGY
jgi:hypothetical protein